MATDLEKLVVSLDADIRQLVNKLGKAGLAVEGFGRKADRDTAAAGKRIADNLSKHTTSSTSSKALTYVQKQEFAHIGRALADEIAAGQSPLRALQVEGGRIVEAFSSGPGGVTGTFKALGSTLLGLASPAALAAAGVLGIGAAAIFAFASFEEAEKAIKLGLSGIGAASGASVSDIRRIGDELARAQGISAGAGEEIALALAKTGKIDVGSIGDVGKLAKGYAAITGTDIGSAGKALGDIFADPARGADKLNAILGTLDSRTRGYIATLAAQGREQDAIKALAAAATPELLRAAEATSIWARAWNAVKAGAEKAGEAVAHVVEGAPADERLGRLQKRLNDEERAQAANLPESPAAKASRDADMADLRRQIAELQHKIASEDKSTIDRKAAVDTATLSNKAGDTVKGTNAEAEGIKTLADSIEAMQRALDTPGVADKVEGGAEKARATLDGLKAKLAELRREYAEGGAAAHQALQEADFRDKIAGVEGYARAVAEVNHQYRLQRDEALKAGDAASFGAADKTLRAARDKSIEAIRTDYENKPSKFNKSVGDAPEKYQDSIYAAAARYNVDPNLLASVLYRESGGFDPKVVDGTRKSSAGAIGVAQFLPSTAKDENVDPTDPASAIPGAARYLRKLIDQFDGDVQAGVAAYNHGAGNVRRELQSGTPFPKETRDYVHAIFTPEADFQKQAEFSKTLADKRTAAERQFQEAQNGTSRASDQARIAAELRAEAESKGIEVSADLGRAIDAQAADMARLARAEQEVKLKADLSFRRDQVGRTSDQQQVDAQLHAAGIAPDSETGRDIAGQLGQIQLLTEGKSAATSFAESITHAMIEARDATEALHSALIAVTEKVVDKAIDAGISALFSAGTSAVGGGGAGGFGAVLKAFGFADGGIVIGPGGGRADKIPAFVSAGEAILPADVVRNNASTVQALIARKYADGGIVGARPIPAAMQPRTGAGSAPVDARRSYQIDARGAQMGVGPQIQAALEAYDAGLPSRLQERASRS